MTYKELEIFCSVYETHNISASAGMLFVSEPSISRIIKMLETRYKARLFDRTSHGMIPTNAGEKFYSSAKKIYDEYSLLDMNFLTGHQKDTVIKIGTIPYFALTSDTPVLLAEMSAANILYQMSCYDKATLDRLAEKELLDIILSFNPITSANYRSFNVGKDQVLAVTGHQTSITSELTPQELAEYYWILPTSDKTNRKIVLDFCRKNGLNPITLVESNSDTLLINLLNKVEAVSFLGERYLNSPDFKNRLRKIQLEGFDYDREVYVSIRRKYIGNPFANDFTDRIRAYYQSSASDNRS